MCSSDLNCIASLSRSDGSLASDHDEKAGILWCAFKDRLGVSVPIDPSFDFSFYFHHNDGLEDLSVPFLHAEIDAIVADCPGDKAPGPTASQANF